jgi:sulfur-carrier protein adenylyltransferase/sulfurtransferase
MTSQTPPAELTVVELKEQLDTGAQLIILDVREAHEVAIAALPKTSNSLHIPLGQLPQRLAELDTFKGKEIVVYCKSGGRSQNATNFLRQNGHQARNLVGGVTAWSQKVDPSVPQY